ncbi:hypothetical protein VNO77_02669 [Canavalia gladiata]|uniref:Uncharacterized protein n=1 Tax=Canavalia gladiata TaxID=3824 RepID=A0AAN9MTF5_CANGL
MNRRVGSGRWPVHDSIYLATWNLVTRVYKILFLQILSWTRPTVDYAPIKPVNIPKMGFLVDSQYQSRDFINDIQVDLLSYVASAVMALCETGL